MTINANDDYEKLAKLLYPSIEASGNVYYGQTKKLLMDEVLRKNDLGFESHIETLNVNNTYVSYFVWRLGPLNGSIKIEPLRKDAPYVTELTFPDSGSIEFISKNNAVEESSWLFNSEEDEEPLYRCWRASSFFAKYKLNITDETSDSTILSGNFKTFYKSTSAEYLGIVCTRDYSPIDGSTDDFINRNFYIDITEDSPILYVKLINHEVINIIEPQNELEKPLTFTYIQAGSSGYHSIKLTQNGSHTGKYQIRKNNEQWKDCHIDTWYDFEEPNDSYSFRRKPGTSFYTQNEDDYIQFVTSGSYILASGNVMSLLDYEFSNITDLSYSFYKYCFYKLFADCINLLTAPLLPATSLGDHCYCEMFSGCSALFRSPELKASLTANKCYKRMFYHCSSLSEVSLTNISLYSIGDFEDWLDQTLGGDIITNDPTLVPTLKANGKIPEAWFDAKRDPLTIVRIDNEPALPSNIALSYGTLPTTNCKYKTNFMSDFAAYHGIGIHLDTFLDGPSYVQFKDTRDFSIDEDSFIYFNDTHTEYQAPSQYKVCGNIASLLSEDFEDISDLSNYQCAFIKLFAHLDGLVKPPILSNFSVLSSQCYSELLNSTAITYAPELPSTELADYCYYGMFRCCQSLINITKLPATTLSDGCYTEMFEGCTMLHGDVVLPAETLTDSCYYGIFYGCSSINKVTIGAKDTSAEDCLSNWLYETADKGCIYSSYTSLNFNSSSGIPSGWIDVCSKFELGITNNVLTQDYPDSSHYNYLVTSGCDSEENGRGIINRTTRFNMLEEEPFRNGLTAPNEYNKKDGSYNQEIWGYKSFNSPVSFKNGIYGECSYLTTVPENEMPNGANPIHYLGSILRCKKLFADYKYESTLKIEYNDADEMSAASLKANYKHNSDGTNIFSEITLNAEDTESDISIKSDSGEKVAEITLQSDSSESSITLAADEVNIDGTVNISNLVANNYDRVVTTHIAVSETTGEEQTIYGEKTFYNTTEFTTNVRATSLYVNFLYSKTSSWPIDINSDLVPANNYDEVGAVSLGSSEKFYLHTYTNTLHSHTMKADTIMSETSNQNVLLYSHLEPKTSDINLGSTDKFYSNTYTTTLHSDLVSTDAITSETANSSVKLQSDLVPNTNITYNLGSSSYHFNQIWSSELKVTTLSSIETGEDFSINLKKRLVPDSGFSIDLGTDGNKFSTVYAKNLDGCIPYAKYASDAGTVSVPVGSIIGVSSNDASYDIAGKIVTVTASTIPIATTIGGASPIYIPAGKYVVLIPINTVLALLMRIE